MTGRPGVTGGRICRGSVMFCWRQSCCVVGCLAVCRWVGSCRAPLFMAGPLTAAGRSVVMPAQLPTWSYPHMPSATVTRLCFFHL